MKLDCPPKNLRTQPRHWRTQVKLLVAMAGCVMAVNSSGVTINVVQGWNLLGNSEISAVDVASRLNDATTVVTVWKWNKALNKWAFYTPSMTSADLAVYAQSKGYDVLANIASKEGYWVNAVKTASLTDPQAVPSNGGNPTVVLLESDLVLGWNLSASADSKTPAQLNAGLSSSLGAAGKSIATQWAWDAGTTRWKFFAPSLAALGGTVLADYITSKTYATFDTVIGPQDGFWLNVSAVSGGNTGGSGGTTPPPVLMLTDTGITASQCYAAGSNVLTSCTSASAIALNASQDGMLGRDVSTPDAADGKLGLSYSSVPNPAGGSFAVTECVIDNITGLTWEGKTATGTRAGSATFTNYDNTAQAQFWNGSAYVNPTQTDIDAASNAVGYKNAVNASALCGYTDWRLPTADELQSLVDYSVAYPGPTIDGTWFPNTPSYCWYWSASPYAGGASGAWFVFFFSGVTPHANLDKRTHANPG
jgi:hypothetical protein